MEDCCRLPRPLSLSSDDLLHEAERMFATKFVSRFPSPENVIATHLVSCEVKPDVLVASLSMHIPTVTSFCAISPSSALVSDDTNRTRSVSDVYALTGAPTIEDDEQYLISTEVCKKDCMSNEIIPIDLHGPLQVQSRVEIVLHKWGPVEPINPELFFFKLLASRGYNSELIPALASQYNRAPDIEQTKSYDLELVNAIKSSDLEKIKTLHRAGRSMSACNKFSESIVHMACRKASFEVAEYVLHSGGDCTIVDDYGRTPLHDACWRMEPRFDIVTLLLDTNLELLRLVDIRGATPLKYVRQEHWVHWCAYFHHQKEKYWVPCAENCTESKRARHV